MRKIVPAKPRSKKDIERIALEVILKHQPSTLSKEAFDAERFFDCDIDAFGVESDYLPLTAGIYGYTDSDQCKCVVSLDLATNPKQTRFLRSTIAHELGHALMHVMDYRSARARLRSENLQLNPLRVFRECEIEVFRNPEWQAWKFATGILMPEPAVRDCLGRGFSVSDLSNRFEVHPAFVLSRLRGLGLLKKS